MAIDPRPCPGTGVANRLLTDNRNDYHYKQPGCGRRGPPADGAWNPVHQQRIEEFSMRSVALRRPAAALLLAIAAAVAATVVAACSGGTSGADSTGKIV